MSGAPVEEPVVGLEAVQLVDPALLVVRLGQRMRATTRRLEAARRGQCGVRRRSSQLKDSAKMLLLILILLHLHLLQDNNQTDGQDDEDKQKDKVMLPWNC